MPVKEKATAGGGAVGRAVDFSGVLLLYMVERGLRLISLGIDEVAVFGENVPFLGDGLLHLIRCIWERWQGGSTDVFGSPFRQ